MLCQLSEVVYKQVLVSLDTKVMPHLTDPRMLIDFLTDSYNLGTELTIMLSVKGKLFSRY